MWFATVLGFLVTKNVPKTFPATFLHNVASGKFVVLWLLPTMEGQEEFSVTLMI